MANPPAEGVTSLERPAVMAWLQQRARRFAVLAGLLMTLAFPPFEQAWGVIFGPALLLLLLQGQTLVGGARLALIFGFAHYVTAIWWVVVSTWGFGGAALPLALLLLVLLASYLALFVVLAAVLASALSRARVALLLLAWPAAWMCGEFLRDTLFHGFPWFSPGYVATDWPQGLAVAALIGVHGLSLLLAISSAAVAGLVIGGRMQRAIALLVLFAILGLHIWAPPPSSWTVAHEDSIDAVLIQGNIPQDQKWLPDNRMPTVELYERMTREAWPADLVIWPEVAIPLPFAYVDWLFEHLDAQATEQGGTLYAGILTQQDDRNFNTVYALGQDSGRYVKSHLVPFGEYIPVPDWIEPMFDVLGLPFPAIASEGMSGQDTLTVNGHQVSMSICFEDVFPLEVRETSVQSGLLVNVTNDAWFAGTAAPAQHLQIARLRAAESGRPMLRVANTGISAVIDADGQLEQTLPWGQRGHLRTTLQPRRGLTPYQRFGRTPVWAGVILVLLIVLIGGRRREAKAEV